MSMILAPEFINHPSNGDPTLGFLNDIQQAGLDANLLVCLDAGAAGSYPGSGQKFLDLTANGDDWFLGANSSATTDDPTFNGSSGGLSSSEYFSADGGDFFRYDTGNEAWMNNIHKNNALFTMGMWIYSPASLLGGLAGTNASTFTKIGFDIEGQSGRKVSLRITSGGAEAMPAATSRGDTALNSSAWNFTAYSIDEATGAGGGFGYLNGAYNQVSGSDTFNATYSSPSGSSATHTMELLAHGNASFPTQSGTRVAGFFFWDTALTKAQLDGLWNRTKGRFGL